MATRPGRAFGFAVCVISAGLMAAGLVSEGIGLASGTLGMLLLAIAPASCETDR